MARPKGMGLLDGEPFTLRMSEERKKEFERRAKERGISMADYARRKIFDEPMPQIAKRSRGRARA